MLNISLRLPYADVEYQREAGYRKQKDERRYKSAARCAQGRAGCSDKGRGKEIEIDYAVIRREIFLSVE